MGIQHSIKSVRKYLETVSQVSKELGYAALNMDDIFLWGILQGISWSQLIPVRKKQEITPALLLYMHDQLDLSINIHPCYILVSCTDCILSILPKIECGSQISLLTLINISVYVMCHSFGH